MKSLLVTGSSGLIGSEVVTHFSQSGWTVHGVDNNMRADFFGPGGDTRWNTLRLKDQFPSFHHHELDIRDRAGVDRWLALGVERVIIGTAALKDPELKARMAKMGLELTGSTPEAFAKDVKQDYKKWGDVVTEIGIKLD